MSIRPLMPVMLLFALGCGTESKAPPLPTPQYDAQPPMELRYVWVASGATGACALRNDETAHCWGPGGWAQVPGVVDAVEIARDADGALACATTLVDEVWCWGEAGRLPGVVVAPRKVPALAGSYRLLIADDHVYTVHRDGSIRVGGADGFSTMPGITNAAEIASGPASFCVLRRDGTVACSWWDSPLTPIAGVEDAVAVFAGTLDDGMCARTRDDKTICFAAITDETGEPVPVEPHQPPRLAPLHGISANPLHACGIDHDGAVWCWRDRVVGVGGAMTDEELDALLGPRGTPTRVAGLGPALGVSVGHRFACAALVDGTVRCWGAITPPG